MATALQLARKGLFSADPNPRVGCVLARDDQVVGAGWHRAAGEPHAEVIALQAAGTRARGATAFVTLEPCSHHGRTPPCATALAEAGVTEVVAAMVDPNPDVDGAGMRILAEAGVACRTGLMANAARDLNRGFISRMQSGRPWVRIKLAQSLDGATALANGVSQWISGPAARRDVQHWRARASAIITGIGTVLADDPAMDVRLPDARRQPLRVILDSQWRTPPGARILDRAGEVLIAGLAEHTPPEDLRNSDAELLPLPARNGRVDLEALLHALAGREINEVHVEAGPRLCGALLQARLVDEILLYQAPCLLGEGARSAFAFGPLKRMEGRPEFRFLEARRVGADLRLRLQPQYSEHPCLPES